MVKYIKIFIDAGHGGRDSGAYNGKVKVKESDTALKVAKELKKCFKSEKRKLKFSRLTDKTVELNSRWKMANDWGSNLCLCIHFNSSPDKKVRGAEVFHYGKNDKELAEKIVNQLSKGLGIPNRGAKEYAWAMTKYPKMPAVLVEVDFISNNDCAKLCKNKKYIKKIARLIYNGVRDTE